MRMIGGSSGAVAGGCLTKTTAVSFIVAALS
jgi:Trk-type K+ transport system membrane component